MKHVLAFFAFATLFCHAELFRWVNPAGGTLNVAASWDPQRVPDSASQLVFTNGNMTVSLEPSLLVEGLYFYATPSVVLNLTGFELNSQTNFVVDCYQSGKESSIQTIGGTLRANDTSTRLFVIGSASQASVSRCLLSFDGTQVQIPTVDFDLGRSQSPGVLNTLVFTNASRGTIRGVTIGKNWGAGSTNRTVISGPNTVVACSSGITVGAAGCDSELTVNDGARLLLTNAVFYVGNVANTNRALVTGNASMNGGEVIVGRSGGSDNLLVFDGGRYFTSDKWLQCGWSYGAASSRNRILVDGDSRIECAGVSVGLFTSGCNNNELCITGPNAYVKGTGNFEAGRDGCLNRIVLKNRPLVVVPGILIGRNSGANSNTFELASGSTLTNCWITLGAAGNSGNEFFINGGFYTNSLLVDPVAIAGSNKLVVANGGECAILYPSARSRVGMNTQTACSLIVTNGGRFLVKDLAIGESGNANTCLIDAGALETTWSIMLSLNAGASSNTLRVVNGGLAKTPYMCLGNGGSGNTTVISNGTVWGTTELRTGFNATSTNNTVCFHGTNDLLKSSGPFLTRAGTVLEFRIPKKGYAVAPIQIAGATTIAPSTTVRVEAADFGKACGGKIPLLTAGSIITTLPTLQSSVPEGCRLLLSGDSKTLLLSVPFTNGTLIKLF